jgi:hypothetical protein
MEFWNDVFDVEEDTRWDAHGLGELRNASSEVSKPLTYDVVGQDQECEDGADERVEEDEIHIGISRNLLV